MALWELEEFSGPQFLGFIRSVPVPDEFMGAQLLPSKTISTLDYEYILGSGGKRAIMATVQGWDAEAPIAGRRYPAADQTVKGELPPIKRKARLSEKEIIKFEQPRAGSNDRMDVVNYVYDLSTELVDSVQARIEWLRMQAISEDVLKIDQEGVVVQVDFGIPVTQQWNVNTDAELTTWWTDLVNSNPILDLVAICDAYEATHGFRPGSILTDPTTRGLVFTNSAVRDLIRGVGAPALPLTEEEMNVLLSLYRLPSQWDTYNVQFLEEDHDGSLTAVRPFNRNKLILLPPAGVKLGETLFGPTAEANQIPGIAYSQYAPGIAGRVYGKDEPPGQWVKVAATAFPTLPGAQYIVQVTVRNDL